MIDIPALTASLSQATPQELNEVIAELEKYRERLVNDTLFMAERAKVMKKQALAQLEPNLAKIDEAIQALRQQHATLISDN